MEFYTVVIKGTPEEGSSTGGSGEPAQAPLEEQSKEKVAAAVKIEPEPEAEPEPEPETKPESSAEQVRKCCTI